MLKSTILAGFAAGLLLGVSSAGHAAEPADANTMLSRWLNAQTNLQTWSADFTQTRALQSLTQPLVARGHVWFAAPNRFRWEIQQPSPTIAVRQANDLWVIYPKLKRAEHYPLDAREAGQWKDTLALLDAGFPRSRAEVESRFNILSQADTADTHELVLQPKNTTARRFMPEIKISFDTHSFSLRSTDLKFTDNSTMENTFANPVINPPIDPAVFEVHLGPDYKISEPFKK